MLRIIDLTSQKKHNDVMGRSKRVSSAIFREAGGSTHLLNDKINGGRQRPEFQPKQKKPEPETVQITTRLLLLSALLSGKHVTTKNYGMTTSL